MDILIGVARHLNRLIIYKPLLDLVVSTRLSCKGDKDALARELLARLEGDLLIVLAVVARSGEYTLSFRLSSKGYRVLLCGSCRLEVSYDTSLSCNLAGELHGVYDRALSG